jgi:sulfate/thiosulfate transport system substrate-binding protein
MTRFFERFRRDGTAGAGSAAARSRRGVRLAVAAAATVALGGSAAACGGSSEASGSGDGSGGMIDLVAYSTPQELYEQEIEPAFTESPGGEGVAFRNSFGSSGDQSRAVEAGLPADFVHLPLEPDIQRLIDAGLVAEDYDAGGKGSPQNSVVVFVTRPGNPEGIDSWDDLVTGDVEVITPNPFTSGGARWNLMAAFGSQISQGKSEQEALDFVAQVLENTPVQDASARDALQTFVGGKGDVLLSYENEAIQAQAAGEDVEYVVPDETILIETKAAVTTEADDPEAAQAFLDFLLTDEGQRLFAEGGYRPVNEEILAEYEDGFPTPKELFEIEEFGGWETVATEFFDPENGSIAQIEADLGVATE